jgi:guanine nucleotide-binding protein G(i) subunit alpha
MILLLNKRDLFEAKIKMRNIRDVSYFQDYPGKDHSYEDGVDYIVKKFMERNHRPENHVYYHVTCATDTSNIHVVFNACKDTIIHNSFQSTGFVQ